MSEKQEADQGLVRRMLEIACPLVNADEVRVSRLCSGRTGKGRPLKVRFPHADCVKNIIQNVAKLKECKTLSGLSFSFDRTPTQQSEYKALKTEITRRVQEGETGLKIRHFGGNPRIVKSKN